MEEKKVIPRKKHQLVLKNRESLNIEGVVNVESFDEQEVMVETDTGNLIIKGSDLHVKELNLDNSTLQLDGLVRSMEYTGEGPGGKGKGLLGRLFK